MLSVFEKSVFLHRFFRNKKQTLAQVVKLVDTLL